MSAAQLGYQVFQHPCGNIGRNPRFPSLPIPSKFLLAHASLPSRNEKQGHRCIAVLMQGQEQRNSNRYPGHTVQELFTNRPAAQQTGNTKKIQSIRNPVLRVCRVHRVHIALLVSNGPTFLKPPRKVGSATSCGPQGGCVPCDVCVCVWVFWCACPQPYRFFKVLRPYRFFSHTSSLTHALSCSASWWLRQCNCWP